MALAPKLALIPAANQDTGKVVKGFQNALLSLKGKDPDTLARNKTMLENELLQTKIDTSALNLETARNQQRLGNIAQASLELQGPLQRAMQSGDITEVDNMLTRRITDLQARQQAGEDVDATESIEALQQLRAEGPQALFNTANDVINVARQTGVLDQPKGSGGLASAKTEILPDGSVVQALPSGEVQVRNPEGQIVTGSQRVEVLKKSQQVGLDLKQKQTDIDVAKAERIASATNRASRISAITKEMNDRNRSAKRSEINLSQAATLVEQASQGIQGVSKIKLAKFFPGIDVSNEAALSQSLTNLALDNLQRIKGPTTDFEFVKTEEISGTLGDGKTANRAKVASLKRANWFNQRESKQFLDHVKNGGDPDSFSFNFGEQIKTKKGVFTLRDLQDTAVANNISIDEALKRLNK